MDSQALSDLISAKVDYSVNMMCSEAGMVSLGELQATLRGLHSTCKVVVREEHPDGTMRILHPNAGGESYCSYRGFYQYIALIVQEEDDDLITDWKLLKVTEDVIGKAFTGYKGGEFLMSKFTPIWITTDYSEASGYGLVDIKIDMEEGILTLVAKNIEEITSYA